MNSLPTLTHSQMRIIAVNFGWINVGPTLVPMLDLTVMSWLEMLTFLTVRIVGQL